MISKLLSMIENNGLVAHSQARLAVYDNPASTLPFMRRNEIIQPIEWDRGMNMADSLKISGVDAILDAIDGGRPVTRILVLRRSIGRVGQTTRRSIKT